MSFKLFARHLMTDLFVTVLVTQVWLGAFILGPMGEPRALVLGSGGPGEVNTDLYLALTTSPQCSGLGLLVVGPFLYILHG